MFLPESIKIVAVFALLFASSCSLWRSRENQNADVSPAPFVAEELKSLVPFESKEPDVYQTEIVLTNYANGEKSERRGFTARNGEKLRCDYENDVSFLQSSENDRFLIHRGKKVYAESELKTGTASGTTDTPKDFLTVEWLNGKRGAKFENLGAENGLTKFRVSLEDAPNNVSETLIYIDENLKIPVRQEFYSGSDGQKLLVFSMELQNLKLEADDKLFGLPKDFRKISTNEFQKIIRQEKLN